MAKIKVKGVIVPTSDKWIYDWFGEEATSPADVQAVLDEADGDDIDVDINSYGGDVFAGSEIYALLRGYSGNVNIHILGLAASAASVIACASHSDISPTAQFMVHRVSTYADGNVHDMEQAEKELRQADRAIAAAYVEKTGMSEKDAIDLMDAETWLTAQDAVDYGLVDEIAGAKNTNQTSAEPMRMAASVSGMLPPSVIDKMQKKRDELLNYFSE